MSSHIKLKTPMAGQMSRIGKSDNRRIVNANAARSPTRTIEITMIAPDGRVHSGRTLEASQDQIDAAARLLELLGVKGGSK